MNCLNTILMPEMNSTPNFTLEINFWWPPTGGEPPYGESEVKNEGPEGGRGAPPPPPTNHLFHSSRSPRGRGHQNFTSRQIFYIAKYDHDQPPSERKKFLPTS